MMQLIWDRYGTDLEPRARSKVPHAMVELMSVVERANNHLQTGNLQVVTPASMDPLHAGLSLLFDGNLILNPKFVRLVEDAQTGRLVPSLDLNKMTAESLEHLPSITTQEKTFGPLHVDVGVRYEGLDDVIADYYRYFFPSAVPVHFGDGRCDEDSPADAVPRTVPPPAR